MASWPNLGDDGVALAFRRRHQAVAAPVVDLPSGPRFRGKSKQGARSLPAGEWEGEALAEDDYVLSTDEKTSVQARARRHPSLAPAPGRDARVEHEYGRAGALQYFAAWDVHRAKIFGRCEAKTGIEPFGRLVGQVMGSEPYLSAPRCWVIDNGSSHHGEAACERLLPVGRSPAGPTARPCLLAQPGRIYNSIIQRKVLTPNDFADLAEVERRLGAFERRYQQSAAPFEWKFTRNDLALLMKKLADKPDYQAAA